MSIASVIIYDNFPFVITDLAFTDIHNSNSTEIPSLNLSTSNVNFEGIRKIDGFGLKTLIVQEILSISFVGNVYGIKKLQDDVIDFFRYREVNIDTFNEMLSECDPDQYVNCSFLFVLGRHDVSPLSTTIVRIGNWISNICNENPNFSISSAGSGAEIWNEEYIKNEGFGFNGVKSLDKFIHKILSNCMRLLSYERRSLTTLKDGWGGGFEIVYYYNGKFHKLNNTAYAFWRLDVDKGNKLKLVSIIHNSYVTDKLIIRNIDNLNAKTYVLRQVSDLSNSKTEFSAVFDTDYIVSVVRIFQLGRNPEDIIVSHYFQSPATILNVVYTGKTLSFKFSEEIIYALRYASNEFLN